MNKRERASPSLRREIREEQHHVCAYCASPNHKLSVHHILPTSLGGPNTKENLVGLCRTPCHDVMDKKYFEEGKMFQEVLMEEGKEYLLPHHLQLPS